MKKRKPGLKLLCLAIFGVSMVLFATGCWDRWEIEDRGIMLAAGLDEARPAQAEGTEARAYPLAGPRRTYRVTTQILVPMPGESGGGGKSGGAGDSGGAEPFWNVSSTSPSVFAAVQEIATRAYREPFFEHLQVIVLGEELARKGIKEPLDYFLHEREARYRVRIYVATGEALKVLEVKPRLQPINGMYLAMLADNSRATSRIAPDMDLGGASRAFKGGQPLVLPRVVTREKEVKLAGSAVFNGKGRLAGWLDEVETQSLRFIRGRVKTAQMPVQVRGSVVNYEAKGLKTAIDPLLEDGVLKVRLALQVEGDLSESQGGADPLDPGFIREVEGLLSRQLSGQIQATVERVQRDLGLDIFGFGREVEKRYPALWREIKPDWENTFPSLPVEVRCRLYIRRVGVFR